MLKPALETEVHSVLRRSPYLLGRKVVCEADGGHVIMRGTVRSYYQKQMAQETILALEGVHQVENLLEVHWT